MTYIAKRVITFIHLQNSIHKHSKSETLCQQKTQLHIIVFFRLPFCDFYAHIPRGLERLIRSFNPILLQTNLCKSRCFLTALQKLNKISAKQIWWNTSSPCSKLVCPNVPIDLFAVYKISTCKRMLGQNLFDWNPV